MILIAKCIINHISCDLSLNSWPRTFNFRVGKILESR